MRFDRTGSFYRALVPEDIQNGGPEPDNWGVPVAFLDPSGCDPITNFVNHSIVFGEFSMTRERSSCIITDYIWRFI